MPRSNRNFPDDRRRRGKIATRRRCGSTTTEGGSVRLRPPESSQRLKSMATEFLPRLSSGAHFASANSRSGVNAWAFPSHRTSANPKFQLAARLRPFPCVLSAKPTHAAR